MVKDHIFETYQVEERVSNDSSNNLILTIRFLKALLILVTIFSFLNLILSQKSTLIFQLRSEPYEHRTVLFSGDQTNHHLEINPWINDKPEPEKDIRRRKFLVRDWSVWLGWNNERYIIETALVLAKLLDRELVLPGFHLANTCELETDYACDKFGPYFPGGFLIDMEALKNSSYLCYPEAENSTKFIKPHVPSQSNEGWALPLDTFLDTENVVSTMNRNSIEFKDFLKLIDYKDHKSLGMISGEWSTKYNGGMSYRKISSTFFTDGNQTVDKLHQRIQPLMVNSTSYSTDVSRSVIEKCRVTLDKIDYDVKKNGSDGKPLSWNESLINFGALDGELAGKENHLFERCIASRGMRSLYAFKNIAFWMKAPYGETKLIRHVKNLRGIYDELYNHKEQILHIDGEIHNLLPAASMLWSSKEGREMYKTVVRTAVRPPEIFQKVAARLELKMRSKTNGRSWRASHMRRGDFVNFGWSKKNIEGHWNTIEKGLNESIDLISREPNLLKSANKAFNTSLEIPRAEDPQKILGELSSSFMDTLAILEQCLIMRSAYYFGDGQTSFTGWIINQRASFMIDERLSRVEFFNR
ncbi:hypothetical protein PPACK8108_LOCUS23642 [Phakopsora pachyrhizi]|uniref:Uncharacterized protein n=1 Tax=Phakopsora pachyrhizi TaxID=170000 RepID=A0AAV0BRG8_PHAPC|nr:hypothetical protein PPACK8108_LOCUS23642 [Phakopsora pachyrhizi]